jgi:hypothetical protein
MGKTERSNGAFGKSDIEGKVARVAASEVGSERVSNGREHMSQCGQRASFNGADGISDMAGKAARVAVEPSGSERDTIRSTGKPREIRAERRCGCLLAKAFGVSVAKIL